MEKISEAQTARSQEQLRPLTEKERKIVIHSCPKASSMNYIPLPLNNTASSTVKKADSALYGIQLTFAQATRPIEYYVRRRIQESSGIDIKEDHEVLFARTGAFNKTYATRTYSIQVANETRGFSRPHSQEAWDEPPENPALSRKYVMMTSTSITTSAEAVSTKTTDRKSNFRGRGRGRRRGSQ
ncbi:hypothetical protein AYI70_g11476 [Smittium culicis]|uniref:Uncharacterized protein n=1 Tax=Smittium culicis TaxID=133412 RepID=A0A1R1X1R1_9FUNG|nr:hypothetical protein AYI70_g11476 [Smittium culicis]